MPRSEPYDPTSALVLSILLGFLGIDRFYIGHPIRGLLKLLTLGGLGIWWLLDIVMFIGKVRRAGRSACTAPEHSAPAPSTAAAAAATAATTEQMPPAPVGAAVEPWTRASMMTEVLGEHLRPEAFAQLLDGVPQNGSYSKVERTAALSLDPHHPHEQSPAVPVWIQGWLVGFLAAQSANRVAPLLAGLAERGQHLSLRATIAGRYDRRQERWTVDVSLELPDPELILPLNSLPAEQHVLLPVGDTVQVTGEAGQMGALAPLTGTGPQPYAATLHILPAERSSTVEVRIDGQPIGALSAGAAESVRPLVQLLASRGLVPVARATVRGNADTAEVTLTLRHGAGADAQWLAQLEALPLMPGDGEEPAGR